MIDYKLIPSSTAQQLTEVSLNISEFEFTFTGCIDEKELYDTLNTRLTILETSLEIDNVELESINKMVGEIRIAIDEKDEIHLRIDWLKRLYETKVEVESVGTKEAAERLRTRISPVQVCPMKNGLLLKLDSLKDSLPPEQIEQIQSSPEQELMEKSLEEAGDEFINLGKDGRELVIVDVLKQFEDKATVKEVRERTILIEQNVNNLLFVKEPKELIERLDSIPFISFFSTLSSKRKLRIAEKLLEINDWNGLASINRLISLLDKKFTMEKRRQEEAKYTIQTKDGKAAFALNIENDSHGFIKIG